ncbi:MAG: hypothetical protein ACFBSC_01555 [Microcoleaceae cyanobacterium]
MSNNQRKQSFWKTAAQRTSEIRQSMVEKAMEVAQQGIEQVEEVIHSESEDEPLDRQSAGMRESIGQRVSELSKNMIETAVHSVESVGQKTQSWVDTLQVDSLHPEEATTATTSSLPDWSEDELYHIFISPQVTLHGGTERVTLKTGKSYQVRIPPHRNEGSNLQLRGCGLAGNDAFVVLHNLLHPTLNVDRKVNQLIVQAPVYERTKIRCLEAYHRISEAVATEDFAALQLLDYLVNSSKLYMEIGQRYRIASQNSRWVGLEHCLESTLVNSQLNKSEKQALRSTYQYLRAGEAIPSLETLTKLDAIILNAQLKPVLKNYYLYISAIAWVTTLDFYLIYGIQHSSLLTDAERVQLLATYFKLRDHATPNPGKGLTGKQHNQQNLTAQDLQPLEAWVLQVGLPRACQSFYCLMQHHFFLTAQDLATKDVEDPFKVVQSILNHVKATAPATPLIQVPLIYTPLSIQNSWIEEAHYAVCRGGLGFLGEIKRISGPQHWIEPVMNLMITQVAELSIETKTQLGLSASVGSRQAVGPNWQAVGSFGISDTGLNQLQGHSAYRAILAELGDLNRMIQTVSPLFTTLPSQQSWQILRRNPDRNHTVRQLETQMYG